jgi:hypothetical protein
MCRNPIRIQSKKRCAIYRCGYGGLYCIEETVRIRITRDVKMSTQALIFNLISWFYLIAGFKAEIRAGLMTKEEFLTTIA